MGKIQLLLNLKYVEEVKSRGSVYFYTSVGMTIDKELCDQSVKIKQFFEFIIVSH